MNYLFIHGFISSHLAQTICRTLLHSVWQGLLAAAISGLIITVTRKTRAAIRYNLLSLVFVCFIVGSVITFLNQLNVNPISATAVQSSSAKKNVVINDGKSQWLPNLHKDKFYQHIINYADKNATLITWLWLFVCFLQIARLSTGLYYTTRLKGRQVLIPPAEWQTQVQLLKESIGINAMVSLMESALVNVPMVIGVLKPVILVPLGMLSQLSPSQVETILLHELAHVRRRDFTMNIIQRVAESFFFFNPFIMWLSARIREEREACCDDIVMQHITDKRSYLEALISFRQPALPAYGHAMTLHRKNNLLYRVKRMITQENKKLNAMEKLTLIFVLVAAMAISFMPAQRQQERKYEAAAVLKKAKRSSPNEIVENVLPKETTFRRLPGDTLPPKQHITFKIYSSTINDDGTTKKSEATAKGSDGKTYYYRLVNNEIKELSIDGAKVPSQDYGRYKGLIDEMELARQELMNKSALNQQQDFAELLERKELLNKKLLETQADGLLDMKKKQQLLFENQKISDLDNFKLNLLNDALLQEKKKYLDFSDEHSELLKKLALLDEKQLKLKEFENAEQLLKLKEMRESPEVDYKRQLEASESAFQQLQMKKQLLANQDKQFHDSNYQLAAIIAELAQAGVIADKNNFFFTLNDDELIVDGKKQSAELHQSLRQKFIKHKKDYFKYKAKPNSRSTDIYVE